MPELAHRGVGTSFRTLVRKRSPQLADRQDSRRRARVDLQRGVAASGGAPAGLYPRGNRRSAAPLNRAVSTSAAEIERLVAYAELRHHGVECTGAAIALNVPHCATPRCAGSSGKAVERPLPVNVTPTPARSSRTSLRSSRRFPVSLFVGHRLVARAAGVRFDRARRRLCRLTCNGPAAAAMTRADGR